MAEVTPLSDQEWSIAYDGPAVAINRILIHVDDAGVRIAFAEQSKPETAPKFRSAIYISHANALTMAALIPAVIAKHQEKKK